MTKVPKKRDGSDAGFRFSPGSAKPKAPPPNPRTGRVTDPRDLESIDELNVSAIMEGSGEVPVHSLSDTGEAPDRKEERIVCSFPGLLKVLVPERSFIPTPMAVRVANLSSGGALVEIHDRAREENTLTLPDRFFELKVAHPEIPELRGTIAWTDFGQDKPLLGLSFFERNDALAKIILVSDTHQALQAGPPPLPEVLIDPFPPITHEETMVLSGTAPEAMEVVVKSQDRTYNAKIIDKRFEIKVELVPDKRNSFTVQSRAGSRHSRQIPIQIMFERRTVPARFLFSINQSQDAAGAQKLRVTFEGNMRQAERILYRFSQIYANGDRLALDATVTSKEEFDKRLVDAMRSEAAVLSADTKKNEVAAKLLDELLF